MIKPELVSTFIYGFADGALTVVALLILAFRFYVLEEKPRGTDV